MDKKKILLGQYEENEQEYFFYMGQKAYSIDCKVGEEQKEIFKSSNMNESYDRWKSIKGNQKKEAKRDMQEAFPINAKTIAEWNDPIFESIRDPKKKDNQDKGKNDQQDRKRQDNEKREKDNRQKDRRPNNGDKDAKNEQKNDGRNNGQQKNNGNRKEDGNKENQNQNPNPNSEDKGGHSYRRRRFPKKKNGNGNPSEG